MVQRLRHLEDERLELMRKATDLQSKAVRYKMLAAKVRGCYSLKTAVVAVSRMPALFQLILNLTFLLSGR
jgi:hypothetical protein